MCHAYKVCEAVVGCLVMEEILEQVYTDPGQPGSYGGVAKLKRGAEVLSGEKVSEGDVKRWLRKKETYTRFRPVNRKFKRNPIIAPHIDAQWQGDLADMRELQKHNAGVNYLLVIIDVVSKYVWVKVLKRKTEGAVLDAMKEVLSEGRKPLKFQTDDGTEFVNRGMQAFLESQGIVFFTTNLEKKAAIAERVIKTFKEKIYRYMHEKHTYSYVAVLAKLVKSYNETYHKSIKMAPSEVNQSNEGEVLNNLYGKLYDGKRGKAKLKEGDFVRVIASKGIFEKGYKGYWTEEIFIIEKVKSAAAPQIMYKLKEWGGEVLKGSYYEKELQLVDKDL